MYQYVGRQTQDKMCQLKTNTQKSLPLLGHHIGSQLDICPPQFAHMCHSDRVELSARGQNKFDRMENGREADTCHCEQFDFCVLLVWDYDSLGVKSQVSLENG